jgi:hypothetical protein
MFNREDLQWNEKVKKKMYSELLEDTYWKSDSGCIEFESGAIYTEREIDLLNKEDKETVRAIHIAKSVLGGDVF